LPAEACQFGAMPRLSKAAKDMEEIQVAASRVLRHVIEATEGTPSIPKAPDTRNAAAVALGKLGASKGGKARAAKLSKKRRKEIAQAGALARWEPSTPSE
jgi:hypothetical protein